MSKQCHNHLCHWAVLGYHFWEGPEKCPRCKSSLYELSEKVAEIQPVSDRELVEAFKPAADHIWRQYLEKKKNGDMRSSGKVAV